MSKLYFARNSVSMGLQQSRNECPALTRIDGAMSAARTVLKRRCLAIVGALALCAFFHAAHANTEKILYNFSPSTGAYPEAALIFDRKGNLYGTTSAGGPSGYGTVFRLSVNGKHRVLYSFTGMPDGIMPESQLSRGRGGLLLGTTVRGGRQCECGIVYALAPDGSESILHTFQGYARGDGAHPNGRMIADENGNLYGTTGGGGLYNAGMVFMLSPDNQETVLYNLGGGSVSTLIRADGALYGTGTGEVFKLTGNGQAEIIHAFNGNGDGADLVGDIVRDRKGNIYGATELGGAYGHGTVYRIDPNGGETVLYSFTGEGDGGNPQAGVIFDRSGNLYGTTYAGGIANSGVVFKITPDGAETVLHRFQNTARDGANPAAGLVMDAEGNLYGTTVAGGRYIRGTIFEILN